MVLDPIVPHTSVLGYQNRGCEEVHLTNDGQDQCQQSGELDIERGEKIQRPKELKNLLLKLCVPEPRNEEQIWLRPPEAKTLQRPGKVKKKKRTGTREREISYGCCLRGKYGYLREGGEGLKERGELL